MRRTRSSARRESEVGESEEEEELVVVSRRGAAAPNARPPPPPPPPPIRAAPTDAVAVQTTGEYWTMTLIPRNHGAPPTRIAISDTMTSETLGRCIAQATYGFNDSIDDFQISGLFCDQTNVFMSLQHILSISPEDHGCIFSLERRRLPPRTPWYLQYHWMALLLIVSVTLLYRFGESILLASVNTAHALLEYSVDIPLQEFYRHAPIIGWEGQSLPSICARITFHGDEVFWRRNLDECERIFSFKEEAFLRMTKPIVYMTMGVLLIYVVRMLVREHALHRRRPQNTEMVETYHALQVLIRQFRRQQHHRYEKDR